MRLVDWEYDGDSHLIAVTVDDDGDGLYDFEIVRHGRWVKFVYDTRWVKCSECGCNWERRIVEECNMDYCPNCGAKMDAEEEAHATD